MGGRLARALRRNCPGQLTRTESSFSSRPRGRRSWWSPHWRRSWRRGWRSKGPLTSTLKSLLFQLFVLTRTGGSATIWRWGFLQQGLDSSNVVLRNRSAPPKMEVQTMRACGFLVAACFAFQAAAGTVSYTGTLASPSDSSTQIEVILASAGSITLQTFGFGGGRSDSGGRIRSLRGLVRGYWAHRNLHRRHV